MKYSNSYIQSYKAVKRAFSKIRVSSSDCWEWIGGKTGKNGYGRFRNDGKVLVHRFLYETFVNKIPKEMTLDHICRNRICVNPRHLRIMTIKENILCGNGIAAVNSKKNLCQKGHNFTRTEDVRINDRIYKRRICGTCEKIWKKRAFKKWYEKNKERYYGVKKLL